MRKLNQKALKVAFSISYHGETVLVKIPNYGMTLEIEKEDWLNCSYYIAKQRCRKVNALS